MKNYIKKFLDIFSDFKDNQYNAKSKIIARDRVHLDEIIKKKLKKTEINVI